MPIDPDDDGEEEEIPFHELIWLEKIEAMRCFATHRYTPQ